MPNAPGIVKLLPGEVVKGKSSGIVNSAILWFDENGKIFTKKPCFGVAYLTDQRFIFEGNELSSAWQNMANNIFWPSAFFIDSYGKFLTITIPLSKIVDITKTAQIRAQPIKITHSQDKLPNPLYFDFKEKDQWTTEMQAYARQSQGFTSVSSELETPPPPPNFTAPTCPTCGEPLTFIEQYQRWYCYRDQKYV